MIYNLWDMGRKAERELKLQNAFLHDESDHSWRKFIGSAWLDGLCHFLDWDVLKRLPSERKNNSFYFSFCFFIYYPSFSDTFLQINFCKFEKEFILNYI